MSERNSRNARRKAQKRRVMRNRIILGLIAVAIVVALIFLLSTCGKNKPNNTSKDLNLQSIGGTTESDVSSNAESIVSNISSNIKSGTSSVGNSTANTVSSKVTDMSGDWQIILVNTKYTLPLDYSPSVTKITAKYASPVGLTFDSRAAASLNAMLDAAHKDGVNLIVISAYRTMSKQKELYRNAVTKRKSAHPDWSDAQVEAEAAKNVAIPGTSEHQLGLAVDFNSVETDFENTAQYRWLKANAEKYGFVNRYPSNKSAVTGIIYEPWHWRYVGVDHAKKMNELGLCLEEYVEYLKK